MITLTKLTRPSSIDAALKSLPGLCNNGIQFRDRGKLTPKEGHDFTTARAELLEDFRIDEILTGVAYINVYGALSRNEGTSYTLKHRMERWGSTVGLAGYVCNGSAILAAAIVGYKIVQIHNSPNCYFEVGPNPIVLGPDADEEDL